MVKARLTLPDVIALVRDLRPVLLGAQVANIYDIDNKTYEFKLTLPSSVPASAVAAVTGDVATSDTSGRVNLVMESGVRFHTSRFTRPHASDAGNLPSGFTMKLRKHLRNRRLSDIVQLGTDRVVAFVFGGGDSRFLVILELYAGGNIILTDDKYSILSLLRTHEYDDTVKVAVRQVYPFASATKATPTMSGEDSAAGDALGPRVAESLAEAAAKVLEGKERKKSTLKNVLSFRTSPVADFGPALLEHAITAAGLNPDMLVTSGAVPPSPEQQSALIEQLRLLPALLQQLRDTPGPGYLLTTSPKQLSGRCGELTSWSALTAPVAAPAITESNSASAEPAAAPLPVPPSEVFDDFSPSLFAQYSGDSVGFVACPSFVACVDEYFSRLEASKATHADEKAEDFTSKRLQKAEREREEKLALLRQLQDSYRDVGGRIEASLVPVDNAIKVIRSALDAKMDWAELERIVAAETESGNPVASLIVGMDLANARITLRLPDPEADEDGENAMDVDIDVYRTAAANARWYYQSAKDTKAKEEKTIAVSDDWMKRAQKRAQTKAEEKGKVATGPRVFVARKPHWFEKFRWFISSDGVVVVAGCDAQQNEQLVKRYMRPQDIYVHADLHGAATCIIRNPSSRPDAVDVIPPPTLEQAGQFTVCLSQAWTAHIITSAWWVNASQVSKTAPTGEYLPTGSFMIRGKKNFLPPCKLELGFGLLFKIDVSNVPNHAGERHFPKLEDSEPVSMETPIDAATPTVDDTPIAPAEDTITEKFDVLEAPVEPADTPVIDVADGEGDVVEDGSEPVPPEPVPQVSTSNGSGKPTVKPPPVPQKQPQAAKKGSEPKRGQKGKAKKAKERYGDQDEEDKRLAMIALGHVKERPNKGGKGSSKLEGESVVETPVEGVPIELQTASRTQLKCYFCGKLDHTVKECPDRAAAANAKSAGDDDDEAAVNAGAIEGEALAVLTLVPATTNEDTVMYCLPMLAPYTALSRVPYKVKIVPGSLKRGKAGKAALDAVCKLPGMSSRERDTAQQVKDQLLVAASVGDCKLGGAAASTAKKSGKSKQ